MWPFNSAVASSSSARRRAVTYSLNRTPRQLRGVLGDAGAQVGYLLADRPVVREVPDAAAMTHREGVLPRSEQRIELGAQGFQVGRHAARHLVVSGPVVLRRLRSWPRWPRAW